jgi:hypothetical protein
LSEHSAINNQILFPVLLLCDENGNYIDFEEHEIVSALENADDGDIRFLRQPKKKWHSMKRFTGS